MKSEANIDTTQKMSRKERAQFITGLAIKTPEEIPAKDMIERAAAQLYARAVALLGSDNKKEHALAIIQISDQLSELAEMLNRTNEKKTDQRQLELNYNSL